MNRKEIYKAIQETAQTGSERQLGIMILKFGKDPKAIDAMQRGISAHLAKFEYSTDYAVARAKQDMLQTHLSGMEQNAQRQRNDNLRNVGFSGSVQDLKNSLKQHGKDPEAMKALKKGLAQIIALDEITVMDRPIYTAYTSVISQKARLIVAFEAAQDKNSKDRKNAVKTARPKKRRTKKPRL